MEWVEWTQATHSNPLTIPHLISAPQQKLPELPDCHPNPRNSGQSFRQFASAVTAGRLPECLIRQFHFPPPHSLSGTTVERPPAARGVAAKKHPVRSG